MTTNKTVKTENTAKVETPVVPSRVYGQPIMDINAILSNTAKSDTDMLIDILSIAIANVDESSLPLDRVTDNELNKRLGVIYAKKVPAKKDKEAAHLEFVDKFVDLTDDAKKAIEDQLQTATTELEQAIKADDKPAIIVANQTVNDLSVYIQHHTDINAKVLARVMAADKVYDDLLQLEESVKSYKKGTNSSRSGVLSSEDAEPKTLGQYELGKLIRNYQSKKSTAKKAGDNGLAEYWQSKVDEASKYRTTTDSGKKTVETSNKLTGIIKSLEAGPQSAEVVKMLQDLRALL